jgi:HEAT repeat protein
LTDTSPDALLKSALEKIVYFEARSEQVQNELANARAEAERHRRELGFAAQREIELRREIAELEVKLNRAHSEREEIAKLNEALRAERASLMGKLIEASRIHDSDREDLEADAGLDLASFISELRSEVIARSALQTAAERNAARPAATRPGDASTSWKVDGPRARAVSAARQVEAAAPRAASRMVDAPSARTAEAARPTPTSRMVDAPAAPAAVESPPVALHSEARTPEQSVLFAEPKVETRDAPEVSARLEPSPMLPVSTEAEAPEPSERDASPSPSATYEDARFGTMELHTVEAPAAAPPKPIGFVTATAAVEAPSARADAPVPWTPPSSVSPALRAPSASAVTQHAERLRQQGRLQVSAEQVCELTTGSPFAGRTEETLFGFSVRELSAPDSAARIRAAERLQALAHPAAAPALATALHAEMDPKVQVALLTAFATLAKTEGAAVVAPLLTSSTPDVRIAALKALLAVDPSQAAPQLSAAMKDPDRAVRRRASLLALGLTGDAALRLGEDGIKDGDPEVRSLAALALGATGGERARTLLLDALRDRDIKVRRAAAQSLSRIVGQDVSAVVELDDVQRRREIRRIATLAVKPVVAPMPVVTATNAVSARVVASAAGAYEARMARPSFELATQAYEASVVSASVVSASVGGVSVGGVSVGGVSSRVAAVGSPPRSTASRPALPPTRPLPPAPSRMPVREAAAPRPAATVSVAASVEVGRTDVPPPPALSRPEREPEPMATPVAPALSVVETPVPAERRAEPTVHDEGLCSTVMTEVRCAIRGRSMADLVTATGQSPEALQDVCELLMARNQLVRRGLKFFAA